MPTPTLRILLKDNIHPDADAMRLCIDAGVNHLGLSLHLVEDNSMIGYEFYSFPDTRNNGTDMSSVLMDSPLAAIRVGRVNIVFNTPETVLVPDELYRAGLADAYMETVHGDLTTGTTLIQEHLDAESAWNLYRIPLWLLQEFNLRYRQAQHCHILTQMLNYVRQRSEQLPKSCLHLWFYPGKVLALLMKSSRVMLLQAIPYEIPEDLAYAVLNACERYGMDPMDIPILVTGLIETDSIVYNELLRYFPDVTPDQGEVRFVQNDFFTSYPVHYFTPAFQICTCAS